MDSLYSTMNQRIKGKHLSFEERVIIQTRIKDGLLHVNLVVPRLPSAMKSNAVLFLFIMAYRGGTRLITVKAFIRLIEYVNKH